MQRKVVTAVFCDVTGSTAIGESVDPEALQELLARYFDRMRTIVESHGGTVEKFIGDAVMAVFGVPQAHEDDALRAVRAAAEMRDALPELGVQARIGVNTGEVVTRVAERLATGDAVNLAARLEQAAAPGEVLIGDLTLALVRDAVETEPLEKPLMLKGKSVPVAAHRLLSVGAMPERTEAMPFVGRQRECEFIAQVWARVVTERRCELVTIIGEAGVGKSRLVAEVLAGIAARVVRGRCLPYGDGITYWPVVEVVRQFGSLPSDPTVAKAIGPLLGEGDEGAAGAEEIAWAFRKLLERAAQEQPLTVVFDDIQWGQETFLDLVDYVALLSSDAPMLLLCMARPELLDVRPTWPVVLRLEPLADEDVDALIPDDLDGELRMRVARAAGGNPLFITEMLAMAKSAATEVAVPPTLQALLAARLDQLEPVERRVLEGGAVEGEIFHRASVSVLAQEETPLSPRLVSLIRKQLIRPAAAQVAGEDAFRFRHLLIRDAAYDAIPKRVRAELHIRFADWLEQRGTEVPELDEILGHHLEQAARYNSELGRPNSALVKRASDRLAVAGRRALYRQDFAGAINLLDRALALLPANDLDLGLELDRVDAYSSLGRFAAAAQLMDSAAKRSAASSDRVAELCAGIEREICHAFLEAEGAKERLAASVERALPVFVAADDALALSTGYFARGFVAHIDGRMDTELAALEQALVYAKRTGHPHRVVRLSPELGAARLAGSTPVSALLAWVDEQEAQGILHPANETHRIHGLAMLGRFEEARERATTLLAQLRDRGSTIRVALALGHHLVPVALYAGEVQDAVAYGRESCALLERLEERLWLSTAAAYLAQALVEMDELEEAAACAARARELGSTDDVITQMIWRQAQAKILARTEKHVAAYRLAREAVALGEGTERLHAQADALADLGEVRARAGAVNEASIALEQALTRYERKEDIVASERTRLRLAQLQVRG